MDALAGSEREGSDAAMIKGIFEDLGLEARYHSIDAALWEHGECHVDGSIRCVPIPPTPGGVVEGVLTMDIDSCSDRVLIASTTSFPDNIWNIYNEALERGARAVIFYDYYPSRYRKIVVSGVWSYGNSVRSSTTIPAVHIRLEDAIPLIRRSLGKRVSITSSSRIRMSRGSTVEAIVPGRSRGSILVSAHHDRWFDSYRDNMIGVQVLLEIARQSRRLKTPRHEVRLVSFTAEEFGDPGMPAWYWGYGSRVYSSAIDAEDILLGIVIDTAYRTPVRISHTSPDHAARIFSNFSLDAVIEGYGHPYTDAPSLWVRGIPTITLHNLEDLYPIYHTDLDVGEGYSGFPSILAREILAKILDLDPVAVGAEILIRDLETRLPQDLSTKIGEKVSNRSYELVRCVNKITMRPLFVGSYREMYRDMITDPFPLWHAYTSSTKGSRDPLVIPGSEKVIYRGTGSIESSYILNEIRAEAEDLLRCVST